MEYILKKINSYKICSGGPNTKYYKSVKSECAFKDGTTWRHKKCLKILDQGSICKYCLDLHRILSRCIESQKKVKERIRVPTTPRTAEKVNSIRKRGYATKKRLNRKEKSFQKKVQELNESAEKIANLEKNKLYNDIDKLNLPENQVKYGYF